MVSSAFGKGFLTKFFTSIDDSFKSNIQDTKDKKTKIRDYLVQRQMARNERKEEKENELDGVLKNLASFLDKSDIEIPEGMTEADFAAQLYKGSGGTIDSGKKLIEDLNTHYAKVGEVRGLFNQVDLVAQGKNFGDYITNFVRTPEKLVSIPSTMTGGVGFLKNVDITSDIKEEMDALGIAKKQPPQFDIQGTALDRTKMVQAQDYAQKKKADDLNMKLAQARIDKLYADAKLVGKDVDGSDLRTNYNLILKGKSSGLNIPYTEDSQGNIVFQIKRGDDKFGDIQKLHKGLLQQMVEQAKNTDVLNFSQVQNVLSSFGSINMQYNDPIVQGGTQQQLPIPPEKMIVGEMYKGKDGGIFIWTGDTKTSISVPSLDI